jgi:hypothetical protein
MTIDFSYRFICLSVLGIRFSYISFDNIVPAAAFYSLLCIYPTCDISGGSYTWHFDVVMAGKYADLLQKLLSIFNTETLYALFACGYSCFTLLLGCGCCVS